MPVIGLVDPHVAVASSLASQIVPFLSKPSEYSILDAQLVPKIPVRVNALSYVLTNDKGFWLGGNTKSSSILILFPVAISTGWLVVGLVPGHVSAASNAGVLTLSSTFSHGPPPSGPSESPEVPPGRRPPAFE